MNFEIKFLPIHTPSFMKVIPRNAQWRAVVVKVTLILSTHRYIDAILQGVEYHCSIFTASLISSFFSSSESKHSKAAQLLSRIFHRFKHVNTLHIGPMSARTYNIIIGAVLYIHINLLRIAHVWRLGYHLYVFFLILVFSNHLFPRNCYNALIRQNYVYEFRTLFDEEVDNNELGNCNKPIITLICFLFQNDSF